jgi:hypothetical protein
MAGINRRLGAGTPQSPAVSRQPVEIALLEKGVGPFAKLGGLPGGGWKRS